MPRLKVDRGITSEGVIDALSELFVMRGVPGHIRSDNGLEFIAHALRRWLGQLGVDAMYIEPGSPWEKGYAESFHGRLRDEFLAGRGKSPPRLFPGRKTSGFHGRFTPGTSSLTCGRLFVHSLLATEIFDGIRQARVLTASWKEYNSQRPHRSPGYETPARFAAACAASASAKASAPAAHAGSLGHPRS